MVYLARIGCILNPEHGKIDFLSSSGYGKNSDLVKFRTRKFRLVLGFEAWENFSFKFGKNPMIQNTDEVKSVITMRQRVASIMVSARMRGKIKFLKKNLMFKF